jgi:hypothetical protein
MSVQDIVRTLYGTYEPTNIWAFEFRKHKGGTITTIFFQLPPESEKVTEGQRADLTATLTGGYITDFGNDFKPIRITGSTHFFYAGPSADGAEIDGYTEFIKLRYMISRYRDYTMTPGGKLHAPMFSGVGLANVDALTRFVRMYGGLADKIDVIYHNFDYDEHWRVKVDELSIDRDKTDPFSIRYDISMRAYQRDIGVSLLRPPNQKLKSTNMVNDIVEWMKNISPETLPAQTPKITLQNSPIPAAQTTGANNPQIPTALAENYTLYYLNQRLIRLRGFLEWANNQIYTGVMTTDRALRKASDMAANPNNYDIELSLV